MVRSLVPPHTIPGAVGLLLLALSLRLIDLFVLRLDEKWGEIILSKFLGMLLVVFYAMAVWGSLDGIGLHSECLWRSLSIGLGSMPLLFVIAYGAPLLVLALRGRFVAIEIAAIDPQAGLTGGTRFALFLVCGNVVNAVMEEALFRGILLPALGARLSFRGANVTQAVLFAAWHVVWPLKHLLRGSSTLPSAVSETVSLVGASFVAGLTFGYMFQTTGSLWTPVIAHALNNTVYNLVHVRTVAGLDKALFPVQAIATLGMIPLMLLVRVMAR